MNEGLKQIKEKVTNNLSDIWIHLRKKPSMYLDWHYIRSVRLIIFIDFLAFIQSTLDRRSIFDTINKS